MLIELFTTVVIPLFRPKTRHFTNKTRKRNISSEISSTELILSIHPINITF